MIPPRPRQNVNVQEKLICNSEMRLYGVSLLDIFRQRIIQGNLTIPIYYRNYHLCKYLHTLAPKSAAF